MSRRRIHPAERAARAKSSALEPAISVLSRSKKAAALAAEPPSALPAVNLEHDRVPLPAPGADRGAAEAAAPAAELVDQGADDARAGGADRVPEGDGAAVHVHPLLVHAQHPQRVEGHRGERLVDLPEVDVLG